MCPCACRYPHLFESRHIARGGDELGGRLRAERGDPAEIEHVMSRGNVWKHADEPVLHLDRVRGRIQLKVVTGGIARRRIRILLSDLNIRTYYTTRPFEEVLSGIDREDAILECSLPACLKALDHRPHLKIIGYLDEARGSCSIYYLDRPAPGQMRLLVPAVDSMTNICGGYFARRKGWTYNWKAMGNFPNIIEFFSDRAKNGESKRLAFVLDDTPRVHSLHDDLEQALQPLTLQELGLRCSKLYQSVFRRPWVWVPGMHLLADERRAWNLPMAYGAPLLLDWWGRFAKETAAEMDPSKRRAWYGWHHPAAMRNLIQMSQQAVKMADPRLNLRRAIRLADFAISPMLADPVHGAEAVRNYYLAVQQELRSTTPNLRPAA